MLVGWTPRGPGRNARSMLLLLVHLLVFVVAGGALTGVWLATGGSLDELSTIVTSPGTAGEAGFWPFWVIVVWMGIVVLHAIVTVAVRARPDRRRRRAERYRARLEAQLADERRAKAPPEQPVTPPAPPPQAPARPAAAPEMGPARALVTLVLCDVVDAHGHRNRLGADRWNRIVSRFHDIVREAVREHGGRAVGTQAEGVILRFDEPGRAASFAVAVQQKTAALRDAEAVFPEIRVGIHVEEAVGEETDATGRATNLASRVAAEGSPGEILVTAAVADRLGPPIAVENRGIRALRGMTEPQHLYAIPWDA